MFDTSRNDPLSVRRRQLVATLCILSSLGFCCFGEASPQQSGRQAEPCEAVTTQDYDLSPITFAGDELSRLEKYVTGESNFFNGGVVITNAVLEFGTPHCVAGNKNQVVDMSLTMDFDATSVVHDWERQVEALPAGNAVWFPAPQWYVDGNGAWIGQFHVKNDQLHVTTEIDYWNRVAISISPDGSRLDAVPANWEKDNRSWLVTKVLKALSPLLAPAVTITTQGLVPPAYVQALDGDQVIQRSINLMYDTERSMFKPVTVRSTEVADFKIDFRFTQAGFRGQFGQPLIIHTVSFQNSKNLPSVGVADAIHEFFLDMKTGTEQVGPDGTEYLVQPGDSLYKIAQTHYRNGKYYLLIAAANDIPSSKMNSLAANKKIRLDSIGALRTRKDLIMVTNGDSLWKISSQHKDFPFSELNRANREWLDDPNEVYPIQLIRIPKSVSKPVGAQ